MASSIHVEETFLHVLKNRPPHIIPKKSVFRFIKVLKSNSQMFSPAENSHLQILQLVGQGEKEL